MSLYDRLTNKLGDDNEESSGNLTPLDIADLPPAQRKIMFSLLRDTKAATEGITMVALDEKLDHPENLETTLSELVQSGWMIETGEGENRRFKVNIRRKRSSGLGFGIWSSLSERITQRVQELEANPTSSAFTPKNIPESFSSAKAPGQGDKPVEDKPAEDKPISDDANPT